MAARTNTGMGVLVALVIFIMLTITLLLLLMLFYTKYDKAVRAQEAMETNTRQFVRQDERTRDDIGRLVAEAGEQNKSLVAYLRDRNQDLTRRIAGNPNLSPTQLEERLKQLDVAEDDSLSNAMGTLRTSNQDLENRAESLERELQDVQARLGEEVALREQMQANQQATIAALRQEIDLIKQSAEQYGTNVGEAEQRMEQRVADIRAQYDEQVATLAQQVEERDATLAQLQDTVSSFQRRLREATVGSLDESSLADGKVVRVLENDEIFVDLGRDDHIVLGMTFNVYGSTTELRPDASGNVSPGKATVEITNIDQTTSTARIIRSTPGRAVLQDDILVNPVYDPNKKYAFFLFGQFDLDGENGPSDLETDIVRSRIDEWGGEVQDAFSGDVDFVVLGEAPIRPIEPPSGASDVIIRQYVRQRRFYEDYQNYLRQAERLSIPVLNQNRLLSLIGYYGN